MKPYTNIQFIGDYKIITDYDFRNRPIRITTKDLLSGDSTITVNEYIGRDISKTTTRSFIKNSGLANELTHIRQI